MKLRFGRHVGANKGVGHDGQLGQNDPDHQPFRQQDRYNGHNRHVAKFGLTERLEQGNSSGPAGGSGKVEHNPFLERVQTGSETGQISHQLMRPSSAEQRQTLEHGQIVGGRYRIVRLIGSGGMGEVYAAEDLRLDGRLRALKLKPAGSAGERLGADEARLQMKLVHPHLPQLHDYFPAQGDVGEMLVMDYVEGQTLEELLLARSSPFTAAETAAVALRLCSALSYLHEQQPPIIHRDLKASNVMIDRYGVVKLIDFGIARRFAPARQEDTTRLGTPGYAAPEQLSGEQSDARTDMYGLGCLLYLLLTRRLPAHRPERRGSQPFWLERMLQPERSRRFSTMREAAAAISGWAEESCLKLPASGFMGAAGAAGAGHAPEQVSVLSLSPGSGGTFVTLWLTRCLAAKGMTVQAVEMHSGQPHWHSLLGMGGKPALSAVHPGYSLLREDRIDWLIRVPAAGAVPADGPDHESRLELMLRSDDNEVRLLDWSSSWEGPEAMRRIRGSGLVLVVADPDPSRWCAKRLDFIHGLAKERESANGLLLAANKDVSFGGRREWLGMLPRYPDAFIPCLSPEEWYSLLWAGLSLEGKGRAAAKLGSGMKPLAQAVYQRFQSR